MANDVLSSLECARLEHIGNLGTLARLERRKNRNSSEEGLVLAALAGGVLNCQPGYSTAYSKTTYVKQNGAEGNTVKSPKRTRGSRHDGGGTGSTVWSAMVEICMTYLCMRANSPNEAPSW